MKRTILTASYFFIFFVFSAEAQHFDVTWGETAKAGSFGLAVQVNSGHYLMIKYEKVIRAGHPILVLVDGEMRPVKETTLEMTETVSSIPALRKFGEVVYLTYEVSDKKETSVYAVRINQQTLMQEGKIVLGTFLSDDFGRQPDFIFKVSPDSSKVLMFVEGLGLKKENKQVYIGVFDNHLKRIWSRYAELPMGGRMVSIDGQDVTNAGKVFISVKHYEKEIHVGLMKNEDYKGDYKTPPYEYKLFLYAKEGAVKQFSFDMQNHFIAGTRLVFNVNGTVTVAGLYKKNPNGNITGAFYNSFDSTATMISKNQMLTFPNELLEMVDKDGQGKSKGSDPGVYSYLRIKDIIPRRNGTVDLISEVHMVNLTTQTNPKDFFYMKEYRNYIYGDIIILNLQKEGGAHFTRIPKRQEGYQTDWSLGYYPISYDDKLILLYNDDADNITRDLSKAPEHFASAKKGVLAAGMIDEKGNLTRKAVYSFREDKRLALPKDFSRISATKYFMISASGSILSYRLGFGTLEIK